MKVLLTIVVLLTVIGAINWGFHAAGHNLVEKIASLFGDSSKMIQNSIYYLVALAGVATLVLFFKDKMYQSDDDKKKKN